MRSRTVALLLAISAVGVTLGACTPAGPSVASLTIPQGRLNGDSVRLLLVGRTAELIFAYDIRLDADGSFTARPKLAQMDSFVGTYSIATDGTLTFRPTTRNTFQITVLRDGDCYRTRNSNGDLTGPGCIL